MQQNKRTILSVCLSILLQLVRGEHRLVVLVENKLVVHKLVVHKLVVHKLVVHKQMGHKQVGHKLDLDVQILSPEAPGLPKWSKENTKTRINYKKTN